MERRIIRSSGACVRLSTFPQFYAYHPTMNSLLDAPTIQPQLAEQRLDIMKMVGVCEAGV